MIGRLLRLGWDRWDDRHWSGDDGDLATGGIVEPEAAPLIGDRACVTPRPSQPGGGCRDCVWTWDIRQGGRWVRQCAECGKGNG